jgi:hypothetical protein
MNKYNDWDYGDMRATFNELSYLCNFMYVRQFRHFIECWSDWVNANSERVKLTLWEMEEWTAIVEMAKTTKVNGLKPIGENIAKFWNDYRTK